MRGKQFSTIADAAEFGAALHPVVTDPMHMQGRLLAAFAVSKAMEQFQRAKTANRLAEKSKDTPATY